MGKNTEKDMRERREIFDLATNKKERGRGKVKTIIKEKKYMSDTCDEQGSNHQI